MHVEKYARIFDEALHNKPARARARILHFPYFRYHNCYLFSWHIYSASYARKLYFRRITAG